MRKEVISCFADKIERGVSALGYLRISDSVFEKIVNENSKLKLVFSYSSSPPITASAYFGVLFEDIERKLSFINGGERKRSYSKDSLTVFERWDLILSGTTSKMVAPKISLEDSQPLENIMFFDSIGEIEDIFTNKAVLAKYISENMSFAIGHHAYRIPFLLSESGLNGDCRRYIDYVLRQNFLGDYQEFVGRFQLAAK